MAAWTPTRFRLCAAQGEEVASGFSSDKCDWPLHVKKQLVNLENSLGGSGLGVELPSLEHNGFLKGSQFDPGLPQSCCRRVLEQDSELLVAPGEQVPSKHGQDR